MFHRPGSSRPDAPSCRSWVGVKAGGRAILAHMIEETARHAGQADILRERIDGATGW
jgi:Protein of unknown function (DUF664)